MFVPFAVSNEIASAIGAVVGGGFALIGQLVSNRFQSSSAKADAKSHAAATALLMQDDFLHYQVTLARSLDRCSWWKTAELLPTQATIEDRKTVWAAIKANETTAAVASAQGWMDYLIGSRKLQPADQAGVPPPLTAPDAKAMRDTFSRLEEAREALVDLAKRDFVAFGATFDMDQLGQCKDMATLLDEERCQPAPAPLVQPQV
jgi:hypothetical protein